MTLRYLLLLLFSVTLAPAMAQLVSKHGRFTIPDAKACAPYGGSNEIVISVPECDGTFTCAIDFKYQPGRPFGDDPPGEDNVEVVEDGVVIPYTYTQPGKYLIAILFGAAGSGDIDSVEFTILPPTPPQFNIYTCSNNSIQLDITDAAFDDYIIDYNQDNIGDDQSGPGLVTPPMAYAPAVTTATVAVRPNYRNCSTNTQSASLIPGTISNSQLISRLEVNGSNTIDLTFANTQPNVLYQLQRSDNAIGAFSTVAPITNTTNYNDAAVNPDQNFYCYRIGPVDICNSPVPDFAGTNTICSVRPSLAIADGHNDVSWITNSSGASELILLKNNTPLNPGLSNTGTYVDNAVTCGTQYCYQYILRYGAIESISRTLCGVAISNAVPLPVQEITTTVDGNGVVIDWLAPENYTVLDYDLFRQPTNVALPLASMTEPTYTDATYTPFKGICYRIRFDDVCGNRSTQSELVCPVELTATLDAQSNFVQLAWNAYAGYRSGINRYVLEKYDASGQLIDAMDLGTQTSYTDNSSDAGQTFRYRILAFSNSAAVSAPSISNVQTIIKSPRLWNPTAFMPEGTQQENQTFSVRGIDEFISSYELRIYNRWGELMFYSTDMDRGWDGTFKGVKMPEGTYVFKTKIVDTAGRTFDHSGTVVLFRK